MVITRPGPQLPKGANDTLERLAETREEEDFSGIVGLEKTFAFNLSGHVLHTMFWVRRRAGRGRRGQDSPRSLDGSVAVPGARDSR